MTFTRETLARMDPRYEFSRRYAYQVLDRNPRAEELSRCFAIDDHPIVAMGVMPLWDGVGSLWIVVDYRIRSFVRPVVRRIHESIQEAWGKGFHRLHAEVPVWVPESAHLMRFLGFHLEAKLEAYGSDKQDFYLFTQVRL